MANRDWDRDDYERGYGDRGYMGSRGFASGERSGGRGYGENDREYGRGWGGPAGYQGGGYLGGFGRGFGGANLGWGAGWGNAPYTGEFGAGGRPGWGGGAGGGFGGYGLGYGGDYFTGYGNAERSWRGGRSARDYDRDVDRDYDRDYGQGSERRTYTAEPRTRAGRHYGRGPRGYRRSDERIREDVNERLTWHPELDASDIEVRVENAEVTLSGIVEDRHARRLAEDLAEDVHGINDVHNELKVRHGFLASLTGEKADEEDENRTRRGREREVERATAREGATTPETAAQSRRAGGRAAQANVR